MTALSRREVLAGVAVSAVAIAAPVVPFTPAANLAGESIFAGDLLMQVGGKLYLATGYGTSLVGGVSLATCSIGSPVPLWEPPA